MIGRVGISEFEKMQDSYFIIDIRGTQSFAAGHLANCINLQSLDKIIDFLKSANIVKPLLFVCFSSIKAKQMALKIMQYFTSKNINYENKINYLDAGVFEALEVAKLDSINDLNNNGEHPNLTQNITKTQSLDSIKSSETQKFIESKNNQNLLVKSTIQNIKSKYLSSNRAFVVAFSGGKDSTCVLQLVYEMLCSLPKELRRPTFAIASNTLVEAPHIESFLKSVIDSINSHALQNDIPFKVIEVAPESKDEFWVNLIGKGYPSPTRTFRWCTERLKINPAKSSVAKIAREYGSVLLCLGTRKQESTNRRKSMQKRILSEEGYTLHNDFPNTLTFAPIAEWSIDDVWGYLIANKPPWGKDHSELFSLYAKASGDECQFITDLRQSSCGGSRFGCWVCTLVSEDKSMQGFINSGDSNLKPLNDFRNYIKLLREDSTQRADYKRDGRAVYKVGKLGAFLSKTRLEILRKLLESEKEYKAHGGENLISDSQILEIQKQWNKDFDFNNSAINLAKEFNRMENVNVKQKSKVLKKEILKEIIQEDKANLGLDSNIVESLLTKSIEIFNDNGSINAGRQIKQEIEKLLNDKTTKIAV